MRTFAILDSGHWNLPFHVALGKVDSVAATAGKCQELQNAGLSVDIHIIHINLTLFIGSGHLSRPLTAPSIAPVRALSCERQEAAASVEGSRPRKRQADSVALEEENARSQGLGAFYVIYRFARSKRQYIEAARGRLLTFSRKF